MMMSFPQIGPLSWNVCVCVFFLRWLLMSRGQSSDLICLSQHVDWIEWPERDTEGRRASWQLSISHYSVENMKQVFGWFSCLLAQSSRRFQLTRASCINERVPVRSAGIGRWTALLQLFHLQNNGKIQRLPHSLCLSFFFPHEFTGSFIGMTLRVHALLTQTMTKMKLHSLQRNISKPQWLLLHFVSFIHLPTTLHLYKPAWTLFQHILTTNPSGNPLLSYFNEQCHFPL